MYTWAIYKASVWKFINVKCFFFNSKRWQYCALCCPPSCMWNIWMHSQNSTVNDDENGKAVGAIDRTAMNSNASREISLHFSSLGLDTIHSNKLLQSTNQFLFATNIQFNSNLFWLGVPIFFSIFFVFIDKKHFLFHHSVVHISTNFSNLYLREVFIIVNDNNCIWFSATVWDIDNNRFWKQNPLNGLGAFVWIWNKYTMAHRHTHHLPNDS